MHFFTDIDAECSRIEETIRRFGYAPEHNVSWYRYHAEKNKKLVFAQDSTDAGLLTFEPKNKKVLAVFSSPLAPPERRVAILLEYLEQVFRTPETTKVSLELETLLRAEFLSALPSSMQARAITYTDTWPIYDLSLFDPALPGGRYKELRNAQNKFYREHAVAIMDARGFEHADALHALVEAWKKKREGIEYLEDTEYHAIIDSHFNGTDEARIIVVDGKPVGINAGWMIPNSERFYGAIGLHDYSLRDLGDVLYLEDLTWLKSKGYKEVDMAGSGKELLAFKNKFNPQSYYKTHYFSVVRR